MKSGLMSIAHGTFCHQFAISTVSADEKRSLDKRPEADVDEEGLTMHGLTYYTLIRPSLLA